LQIQLTCHCACKYNSPVYACTRESVHQCVYCPVGSLAWTVTRLGRLGLDLKVDRAKSHPSR
jgi:hypothetical protein